MGFTAFFFSLLLPCESVLQRLQGTNPGVGCVGSEVSLFFSDGKPLTVFSPWEGCTCYRQYNLYVATDFPHSLQVLAVGAG